MLLFGLTHNAHLYLTPDSNSPGHHGKTGTITSHAVESRSGSVMCVNWRCCDVPRLARKRISKAALSQLNYYNRALSGWEPFLEPWRCGAEWDKTPSKDLTGERLSLSVKTEDTVNVNVTNTLLELYHMVKNNWTLDYYNRDGCIHSVLIMLHILLLMLEIETLVSQ
ncbi:uncharacterized protein LOC119589563 [Penaeus monodon]|uniref:uncharacterized protein LOC119589563 n=1 Tax=Penaeus monodon TaxID=6687 RepID=UPI0018A79749|nr:uncharacterized protein LOC119589563 [Penaeus monodon]